MSSMASDSQSTVFDVDKVDGRSYDKEASTETIVAQPTDFPDGGAWAWMTLVGSFFFQFCSIGYTNAFGVYNDYYTRIYLSEKSTASQISWIGSLQLFGGLFVGIISGRALDTGYFYHTIIGGALLFSFSLFMLSLSHPEQYYQVLLAQGIANSIAIGLTCVPTLAVVSHYFKRRRAFALGISTAGSAVGGIIHPIMLNKLFHSRIGFHNGVRASAGLTLGLTIISTLLMKPRLPPKRNQGSILLSLRTFMQEPAYVLVIFGHFLVVLGLYFPSFFLQLYAIKQNINPTLAFYSLAILNATSVVGRIVPNLFVHKYGVMNILLICSICCAIIIFCFLAVKNVVGYILFTSVYGFFLGAYISVQGPMIAGLSKKESEIGERFGIYFALTSFGALIGNPIAGALLTASYTWWKATLFAGLAVASGTACHFCARLFVAKEKGTGIV